LINSKEILNSFGRLKPDSIGLDNITNIVDSDTLIKTIEDNLHLVISSNPTNTSYKNIFYNYPYIFKICFSLFIEKWTDTALELLATNMLVEDLNILPFTQITTSSFFLEIHNFMIMLAESYSDKLLLQIKITSKNFIDMLQFYEKNYKIYKEAIKASYNKYEWACEAGDKTKKLIEASLIKMEDLEPQKKVLEKEMQELKESFNIVNTNRNNFLQEIKDFENPIKTSKITVDELNSQIKFEMSSYIEKIQTTSSTLNKIEKGELVDFRNLIDNHNPSKFLMGQAFSLLGENSDYDYVKKNMDPKFIKNLIAIDYTAQESEFVKIINDTVKSPDFIQTEGYSKIYTVSIKLNEWFLAVNKYNKARVEFRNLYKKVKDIEKKLVKQNQDLEKKNQALDILNEEINKKEKDIQELERNKLRIFNSMSKYTEMNSIYTHFIENANQKLTLWKAKKDEYEISIKNFEFCVIFLSAYVAYAGVFNNSYRKKIKSFFKSKVEDFLISNIKKVDFIAMAMEMINLKKDKDLLNAINPFDDNIKENFLILFYNKNVPYIIDHYRVSKSIFAEYLERKDPRKIIVTKSQDNNFMEQIEKSMLNGYYLMVEQSDEKTYTTFKNVIKNRTQNC